MGSRKERTTDRLFSNRTKLSLAIGFAVLCVVLGTSYESHPDSSQTPMLPIQEASNSEDAGSAKIISKNTESTISAATKSEIETLFQNLQGQPETKEKMMRQLRRRLQEIFAGQEDCWSCEGAVYFDRFDKIAGAGAARKPIGFREWLQEGDDAFENNRMEEARKFYSSALQVMDERSQQEDAVDSESVERLQSRCVQLGCR